MNRWKYIFWDWNGTILDDLDYNYKVINSLLSVRYLPQVSLDKYRSVFCFPIKEFYEKVGFNCNSDEYYKLVADYQQAYGMNIDKIKIADGVYDIIKSLHFLGIKQIIFSSCNKAMIQQQLSLYNNFDSYIDEIIAQDNDFAVGKESLAIDWGKRENVSWKDVLIIGDTYYDKEVANNLGCDCILISTGHQKLEKKDNICICDDVSELLIMLKIVIT